MSVGRHDGTDYVTDRSLLSGRVKRYNTWPTITSQTDGDHTWGVYHVYWRIFGMPSAEVALFIHLHDAEELVVGDNPYPSKANNPKLKEAVTEVEVEARERLNLPHPGAYGGVSDLERARVKVCDLLEMMQFGMQEREMGNLLAGPIVERTMAAALELSKSKLSIGDEDEVIRWVRSENDRHQSTLRYGDRR